MKRCKSGGRRTITAVMTTALIVVSGGVFAQSVDDVLKADQRRIDLAQASQEKINGVVERTRTLEDQYRAINKEIDGLRVYNRLMTAQTNGQKATLEDIGLSMDQVDVINRQIFPLMVKMIDGLERMIKVDMPFLMEEREGRVATLQEIIERSDVTVAEKFRKVMEAYQIELDYGSSSEWYKEELELDGVTREYNMLRVGRIGLYFQSDDSSTTGWFNRETNSYEILDSENRSEIRKGIRIARQLVAPELVLIPLPAPETLGGA